MTTTAIRRMLAILLGAVVLPGCGYN